MASFAASNLQAAAIDDFKTQVSKADSEIAVKAVIQDYLPRLKTVDELRELQNVWQQVDPDGSVAYFRNAAAKEPNSPIYQYLVLRFEENRVVQMDGARKLCKQHPDFYWGYRLLSVNLSEELIKTEKDDSNAFADQEAVFALVENGLKHFPEDAYLNLCMFHRYRIAKDDKKAGAYLLKVNDPTALYSNWAIIKGFIIDTGNMSIFETVFKKILADAVAKGQYTPEESHSIANSQRLELYESMENWDAIAGLFSANEMLKDDPSCSVFYEKLLLKRNNHAALLDILNAGLEKGDITVNDLQNEARYKPLYPNPRWNTLLKKAEQKWLAGEPLRKSEALKDRIGTPAPLWELPDANGKMVKLTDLKGQIVVLDFWATWCGPCRMAMPALDGWMKTKMPANVKVFSINVWENAPDKARQYFSDNAFAMTLLFAENSISKDYGFNGIPYICVIDKKGNVAYAQSGYSETLEDNLGYWVEALTKE
jgi:thiol-disulfide isomerase/thioredoxin